MKDDVITPIGMDRIFLLPGDLCVTEKPVLFATLLGSCVAVCVYNRKKGIAGMNHFLRNRRTNDADSAGKFGDSSTRQLIKSLLAKDNNARHFEAKIFGGGEVVGNLSLGGGIGKFNIGVAREILKEFNIPIVEEDVGGKQGRKVYFNTKDFTVQVRDIESRHKDYSGRKIRVLIVDDVDLVRKLLRNIIEKSSEFEVCAEAANAFEARDKIVEMDPDIISLDIIMPGLDGLDFLKKIMQYKPKPVVIVSTIAQVGSAIERRAKELGAVGVIDKEDLELYKFQDSSKLKYIVALKAASMSIVNIKK
ncbi:MAG: response regulator [Candidatus Omnitrophica bacterium]|nr:response regulator [Candidatus Omnitrophota bacterium]